MNNLLRVPSRQFMLPPPPPAVELLQLSLTRAKALGICPDAANDTHGEAPVRADKSGHDGAPGWRAAEQRQETE